ncbi:hypothetical protein ANN_00926 [Periplaneta americana]|uniref:Uncharacterized protein n=1 Tax=Periplaneta americana TaxID=6978 RepID=A0ABQ8TV53_PERAM|nr:hypothetical protein ANN_00926 [Periplaneta americana]
MAGLCEDGNEPPRSLKAIYDDDNDNDSDDDDDDDDDDDNNNKDDDDNDNDSDDVDDDDDNNKDPRGEYMMRPDQDYAVDVAELPT